jgi:Putative transposase
MADLAAHLVDRVWPDVPVRQWVLTLPHRVRLLCAYDKVVCSAVRRILVRAVSGFYLQDARRAGLPRAKAGAVVHQQRFDSAVRLNVHFHALWADGVFANALGSLRATFHPHGDVTDRDVANLLRTIAARVRRWLRKHGKLQEDQAPADDPSAAEPDLLQALGAAAIQGRTAHGPKAGAQDVRPGRGSRQEPFVPRPLTAELDGFSLHAAVRIPQGCRAQLERLCRYAARPPVAEERLSLLPDGRVQYKLKRRWRDGSTSVVLDPCTLIERLCALVPRPRQMLMTYHGVLAPAAGYRHRVVPPPPLPDADDPEGCRHQVQERRTAGPRAKDTAADDDPPPKFRAEQPFVPHAPSKNRRPRSRHSWAELMRRVFLLDVLTCGHCGGPRKLLAAIFDQDAIQRILAHLGLPTEPPALAKARAPPARYLPR